MRFVLWSGCHWVSLGARATHYDTDINKSEALWFSRPGKVCWLPVLKQFDNGVRDVTIWQWWKQWSTTATLPHARGLKQGLLSYNFQPSCRILNISNQSAWLAAVLILRYNLPSQAHVFCPITWTKISRNPLNQRTGLLTCSEDFWCWDCDKMNVENFSRKVVVCWYPTRRYWLGLDISDYTQWHPE